LLGILIFKGLTARRLYKSFGVKGLTPELNRSAQRCLQIFFTGILIFKRLTARRLYKLFGVKGLTPELNSSAQRCLQRFLLGF
jgi:hypothetical protein